MDNPFLGIEERLKRIEGIVSKLIPIEEETVEDDSSKKYSISQLSEYLPEKPARQTIYGWVCHRKIPFQKHGSRLFFVKGDIDKWLDNGRVMSHLKEWEVR